VLTSNWWRLAQPSIQRRLALVDDLQPELEESGRHFFSSGSLIARYSTATGTESAADLLAARFAGPAGQKTGSARNGECATLAGPQPG